MSNLYRTYRPQNFSEVLGQKHIKVTLQNEISTNNLAQAFLFCGPRAVGKTTMARVLAKSANCTNRKDGEYEPCDKCDNCKDITSGSHLDIIEIDAASNTGVDNVRENIISFSRLSPSRAKYKVFIIDEVHMLSPSAFNALLKIIEEPPAYVMFVLCTTEVHKVPYTIVSRCERFDFKRIGVSDIVSKLQLIAKTEKKEIDQEVLEAIARRSGGHLRDAESLLGQIFSLSDKRIGLKEAELVMPHYNNNEVIDLISYISKKDSIKALTLVNTLADAGVNIKNFISETVSMLRKIAISKLSPELSDNLGLNLGDSLEIKINKISSELSLNKVLFLIKRFIKAHEDRNQLITQLPLELAVIESCLDNQIVSESKVENDNKKVVEGKGMATLTKENKNSFNKDSKDSLQTINKPIEKNAVEVEEKNKKTSSNVSLSCEQVMDKWPEFLVKIKKHNHSLSFVLQNCEPQELNSGRLRLVFKYKFHQDRVKDGNIKKIIEDTLAEVFGGGVLLDAELDENLEIKDSKINNHNHEDDVADNMEEKKNENNNQVAQDKEVKQEKGSDLNNLLKTFGGEVIN